MRQQWQWSCETYTRCSASTKAGGEHWHSNQGARQITADALRATADALAPEQEETSLTNDTKSIHGAISPIDDHYSDKQAAQ